MSFLVLRCSTTPTGLSSFAGTVGIGISLLCAGETTCQLSPYLRKGNLAQTADGNWAATVQEIAEASSFAQLVLNDNRVSIPPAVVLDVGLIENTGGR